MELTELYRVLESLRDKGVVIDAYGGSNEEDPDDYVLNELIDYIYVNFPDNRPIWLEAFYQVFGWQFNAQHEGLDTYYSNFYGDNDRQTIMKVAEFLKNSEYTIVAEKYISTISDYEGLKYPENAKEIAELNEKWGNWIVWNREPVWDFYVDILEKHKEEFLKM